MDFSSFSALLVLAILVEATVQIFIKSSPSPINNMLERVAYTNLDLSHSYIRWISAVIGILYAFNMNLDIFLMVGFPSKIPLIGTIATGLITSRGANFIHDLAGKLVGNKETIV